MFVVRTSRITSARELLLKCGALPPLLNDFQGKFIRVDAIHFAIHALELPKMLSLAVMDFDDDRSIVFTIFTIRAELHSIAHKLFLSAAAAVAAAAINFSVSFADLSIAAFLPEIETGVRGNDRME
eukprot:IDg3556t1